MNKHEAEQIALNLARKTGENTGRPASIATVFRGGEEDKYLIDETIEALKALLLCLAKAGLRHPPPDADEED